MKIENTKERNRIRRVTQEIHAYNMNMHTVITEFEITKHIGKLVLIQAFSYITSQLKIGKCSQTINRIVLDSTFKKRMASTFGHSDASNVRKYIKELENLGLLQKVNKHTYLVNPLIAYRGSLRHRLEVIDTFYQDIEQQKGLVWDKFVSAFESVEQVRQDIEHHHKLQIDREFPPKPTQSFSIQNI